MCNKFCHHITLLSHATTMAPSSKSSSRKSSTSSKVKLESGHSNSQSSGSKSHNRNVQPQSVDAVVRNVIQSQLGDKGLKMLTTLHTAKKETNAGYKTKGALKGRKVGNNIIHNQYLANSSHVLCTDHRRWRSWKYD